jgi:hypothetical protein
MKFLRILSLFLLILEDSITFPQERQVEKVLVKAMPIYVRVFHRGEIVKDLKKEDFEIYENGIKKEIKGFEKISRKISSSVEGESAKKRLFILIFNVFDYTPAIGEGIDYFFNKIYRKEDKILVVVEDKIIPLEGRKEPSEISSNLKEVLKKYKNVSSHAFFKAFEKLKYEGDELLLKLQQDYKFDNKDKIIYTFLENYKRIWDEYRREYINPDLSFYKNLVRRVRSIDGEKWAIVFYQRELFPKLKNYGRIEFEIRKFIDEGLADEDPTNQAMARNLYVRLKELQRSFDVTSFPWEDLKNIFTEENITYHLIFMKSLRDTVDEDLELGETSQDFENSLREISISTGGSTVFSNKPSDSLMKIEEKEDVYYLLWFTPSEIKGKRKIDIKVKRDGVKVYYTKELSEIETSQVKIIDFRGGDNSIELTISNFKMENIEGKKQGLIEVKITIYDENSNIVFSEGKTLNAFREDLHIKLRLDILQKGKNYFGIAEVSDKLSNSMDVVLKEIKL